MWSPTREVPRDQDPRFCPRTSLLCPDGRLGASDSRAAAHKLRSLLNQSEMHPKHWNDQLIPCGPLSPVGPCAFPPKEAALLQATGQRFRLCSRWIQEGSGDQAPVGGRQCPTTTMGRFEFRCVGPCSRNRNLCLSLPREESLERGHQSRFAFPLGPLPRPVGSRIRRRGELGCCLESVGWASLQGSLLWREKDVVDVCRRADRLTVTPLGHHRLAFLTGSSSTWGGVTPGVPGPSLQPDWARRLLRGGPSGWEPRAWVSGSCSQEADQLGREGISGLRSSLGTCSFLGRE